MVIRLILRYLANNEQLVQRLSESYPIQAAARFVVNIFYKGKGIVEEKNINPTRLSDFIRRFAGEIKSEIKTKQEELKKNK